MLKRSRSPISLGILLVIVNPFPHQLASINRTIQTEDIEGKGKKSKANLESQLSPSEWGADSSHRNADGK